MSARLSLSMMLVGALATAACGGGSKATVADPGDSKGSGDAASVTCDDAGGNLGGLMSAQLAPIAPDLTEADRAEITRLTIESCAADGWSAELIACSAVMTSLESDEACNALLTEAQKEAFGARVGPVVQRIMGAPGGGAAEAPSDLAADPCEGGE